MDATMGLSWCVNTLLAARQLRACVCVWGGGVVGSIQARGMMPSANAEGLSLLKVLAAVGPTPLAAISCRGLWKGDGGGGSLRMYP